MLFLRMDEREVHVVRVAVPIFDAYVERGFTKRPFLRYRGNRCLWSVAKLRPLNMEEYRYQASNKMVTE